jgi:hypothetical protein
LQVDRVLQESPLRRIRKNVREIKSTGKIFEEPVVSDEDGT